MVDAWPVCANRAGSRFSVNGCRAPSCGRHADRIEVAHVRMASTLEESLRAIELADKFGAGVEFVSTETDERKQLLVAFKGLAALLRFKAA